MTVTSLHHVAIRVQDPERSRAFYEKVLGLASMETNSGSANVYPSGKSFPPGVVSLRRRSDRQPSSRVLS
jgi:catechol 2,3-dioxygenase-like lactoylglutathione lyase family enzyme